MRENTAALASIANIVLYETDVADQRFFCDVVEFKVCKIYGVENSRLLITLVQMGRDVAPVGLG